jgi:hypothetical protein
MIADPSPSSQLIGYVGLPVRVSQQSPMSRSTILPKGPDASFMPGQRIGLPLNDPRHRLPRTRHQTPTHTPLLTTNQRQRLCLHPHLLGGWAYGAIYRDSGEHNAALAGWIDFYNHRRPHGAISHKPPAARLNELNNLLGSYT